MGHVYFRMRFRRSQIGRGGQGSGIANQPKDPTMHKLAREAAIAFPPTNVTPPWLLFFLRRLRACNGHYALAWRLFPGDMPPDMECPSIYEGAAVLARHRLVQ